MDIIQASIQKFASYPTLKKLALMMVSYKSTSEEVGFLRNMFSKYDITRDGAIMLSDFKQALADHYDYSDIELENLFHGIDINGTGKVHYIEFVAATIEAHGTIDEERLAEAFDRIDSDDSDILP
jgi:calcium-dependent protein kinase